MEFIRKLKSLPDDESVLSEFPQFYADGADPSELISMYKRYAEEIQSFLNDKASIDIKKHLHVK